VIEDKVVSSGKLLSPDDIIALIHKQL